MIPTHEITVSIDEYKKLYSGKQKFLILPYCGKFKERHIIHYREYDEEKEKYTGASSNVRIRYILKESSGLLEGYCILGVEQ